MTGGRAVSPISRVGAACCGCAECAAACPARCISMKADKEGFARPVVDASGCTGCGACSKACPALSGRRGDGVLSTSWAVSRDGRLLDRSSSGGVFGQMARRVISRGGAVYGARWERACRSVSHARADDPSSLEPLLMSKYLQSTVRPETYAVVERDLAEGRTVLYCGTACQVAGLTGHLEARGVERGRLLAVDVICHGAPSPLLWERWRAHVGRSRLSRVRAVDFRRKDPSWEGYSVAYGLSGGRELLVPHAEDWYLLAFLRNICLRPSCAACPAKGRCGSDVTLGDFWGIGRAHPEVDRSRGVSALIARTERGARAIEEISDALVSGPSEYASVLEGNPSLERSPAPHPDREAFMSALSSGAGAAELRRRWPLGLPPEPTVADRFGRRLLGLLKGRNR